ncbi:MAG: GDSL-type esterase/lipase family protein [Myxococcota bacterium]|nr:GDSL-type esterase/lipase family protein [Myxococcota bacterium]
MRRAFVPFAWFALAFVAGACGGASDSPALGQAAPQNEASTGSSGSVEGGAPSPVPTGSGSGAVPTAPVTSTALDAGDDAVVVRVITPEAGPPPASIPEAGAMGAASGESGARPVRPDGGANVGGLPNVTLFVAGDSTASVYGPASAQQGWGEHLADFLISKVTVDDQAFPGRTVKTFMMSSRWTAIEGGLKPGDFVMIEFGINDSSGVAGRFVPIPEFTTLIGTMVDAVLAKQATPILVTPTALQYWTNGVETNAREQPYADAMKQVATQKQVLVDDLNARSVEYLNLVGQTAAAQIYINGDKAHFTLQGATQMAKLATQELLRIGSPLGAYVK